MLRLALLLALWFSPAAAEETPYNNIFVPSPNGQPLRIPTVLFFEQLGAACHVLAPDKAQDAECRRSVAYLQATTGRLNLKIAEAFVYRYSERYGELKALWREIMDENQKLSAAARALLEQYPKSRAFVRQTPSWII